MGYAINSLSKRYMGLDVSPQFDGYSGVEIVVDENTSYFAGSVNGRVITIQNPWGTQAQADNILAAIQGFQYQPYTADGALLDPAAEIGDGVSLNGMYSGLYKISRNYSSLMATNISAPQDEEIDHEYPFETKTNREITRKFMAVESEFTLQSTEIAAKVSKTSPEGQTSFSWNLTDSAWEVKSNGNTIFKVDNSGAQVTGVITATSGMIGNFNIGDTAIWNNISSMSGVQTTGVYLGTDGIKLGQKFSVDKAGNATASKLTVDTLVIGNEDVSAATLNSRANYAYGSTTSGGFCYGNALSYSRAIDSASGIYPGFFKAISMVSTNMTTRDMTATNLTFKNYAARWQDIVINGTTYHVMTHA